jgi:hypothetical protein
MTALEEERQHLALSDRHIAEGEGRVRTQVALIARLRTAGQATEKAEGFLALLEETLTTWRGHREMILASIARREAFP